MIHAGPYIRGQIDSYRATAVAHRARWTALLVEAEQYRRQAEDAERAAAKMAEGTDYYGGEDADGR